jgi:hypothetical protein
MHLQNIPETVDPLPALGNLSLSSSHRILVIGCAYGGISAVVNLLDLSRGQGRDTVYPVSDLKDKKSRNGVEITVIDERDGYCMLLLFFFTNFTNLFGWVPQFRLSNILISSLRWRTTRAYNTKAYVEHVEALLSFEGITTS